MGIEKGRNNLANLADTPLSNAGLEARQAYLSGSKDMNKFVARKESDKMVWAAEEYGAMSLAIEELWRRMLPHFARHPVPVVVPRPDWWQGFKDHYRTYVLTTERGFIDAWLNEIHAKKEDALSVYDKAYLAAVHSSKKRHRDGKFPVPSSADLILYVGDLGRVIETHYKAKFGRRPSPAELRGVLGGRGVMTLLMSAMVNSHEVFTHLTKSISSRNSPVFDAGNFELTDGPNPQLVLHEKFRAVYQASLARVINRLSPADQHTVGHTLRCPLSYSPEWMQKILTWMTDEAVRQYGMNYKRKQK